MEFDNIPVFYRYYKYVVYVNIRERVQEEKGITQIIKYMDL